jgi:short-subunit dehydrogenase
LARCFAADGTDVVLVARRQDRLETLAESLQSQYGITATPIVCDLGSDAQRQRLVQQLHDGGIEIDALVNNAGFGLVGRFAELAAEEQLEMLRLNVMAVTDLTRQFLPLMLQRGRGGILMVASTAAFQPGPNMAVYFATKAYLLSLGEALAEEARGTGVQITCLCPGPTATEFGIRSLVDKTLMFQVGTANAETVARQGYAALLRRRVIFIPGWGNRRVVNALRIVPRWLVRRIASRLTTFRASPV